MSADGDRFDTINRFETIKSELNEALESRIGHLLGVVRAAQSLTRQIVAADDEIRRNTWIKEQLEAELQPLDKESKSLGSTNAELKRKVDAAKSDVSRMRSLREELMSTLSGLKGASDGAGDDE
jgi:chromosome segregation ATPase